MSQLQKKFIAPNAVDGSKIRLSNAEALKARNAANSADVNILSVNASDKIEFASVPQVTADPSSNNDLARKSYVDTGLSAKVDSADVGAANGVASLDANGLVPITQIPAAALERLIIVADEAARFALTTATAQNGDTVKQTDTGILYFIKDDTNLDNAAGYEEYTAGTASSVAWSGVTGTPTTIAGYGITDAYTKTEVDGLLADKADSTVVSEIDQNVDDLITLSGVAENSTNLGTFTGSTIPDSSTIKGALQALETSHETAVQKIDNLNTLSGVAANSTDLGTFTGSTIPDSSSIKGALQALETALEAVPAAASARQQVITLSGGDITNQYIDLAFAAVSAASIQLTAVGGPLQVQGVDYTVALTGGAGGVTRLTFDGDLATSGAAELVAADVLIVTYLS